MIATLLLLLFSIWLFKQMLKWNKYYFFCFLLPYVMFVWKMISLSYLESGAYSPEIVTYTYKIHSDYMFLLQMSVFWVCAYSFVKQLNRGIKIKEEGPDYLSFPPTYRWIRLIHCAVIAYLYLNLALSGTAVSGTYNRFGYFDSSRLPFISLFSGTLSYFFLFIDGVIFFFGKKNRKLSLVLFLFSIMYQILIGNKFSGLYQYTFFFLAPYFLLRAREIERLKIRDILTPKVIILCCLGFAFLLGIIYLAYLEKIERGAKFTELLFERILNMQSGTVWGISKYINSSKYYLWGKPQQLLTEIEGVLRGYDEFDTRVGLGRIMAVICPKYVVNSYLSSGVRLSGWYLVVTYLSLGYIGSAVYSVFLAFVFSISCVALVTAARRKNVIMIAIMLYFYYQIYDYYRIGNYSLLFNLVNIGLFVIATIYVMAAKKGKRIVFRFK